MDTEELKQKVVDAKREAERMKEVVDHHERQIKDLTVSLQDDRLLLQSTEEEFHRVSEELKRRLSDDSAILGSIEARNYDRLTKVSTRIDGHTPHAYKIGNDLIHQLKRGGSLPSSRVWTVRQLALSTNSSS